MAADQRKRRPNSIVTPFGSVIQEQYRAKKREFRSLQCDFNYNSHVSLKWDDNEKMVVAKEDQIGIASRHLASFGSVSNAKLADVVVVPKEVFELGDLTEVLTNENWQSLLTEKDRIFLAQFLPRGFDSDEVVQTLLGCENFHFGNPFLKWSSSLCSGDLHPDAVIQHEKSFKANKKAYYSELQEYHENMIKNLLRLKVRCGSSKDPESEILKIMSRSKGHAEKNVLSDSNGFNSPKLEANALYESTSSIADDKSYYSDNLKLSDIRDAEIQRRNRSQELVKDKHEKLSSSPNGLKGLPRPKKAEKSQKANIGSNDGSKYMSYVKISKKQHEELVLSMGQSCPRLLGNLDSYNVKPYVMFGEEEQKRIHEHWTNLVNKDLPKALKKWRRGQLERLQVMGYLCQELEDKLGLLTETQNEKLVKPFGERIENAQDVDGDNKYRTHGSISDDDKPTQCSSQNETFKESLSLNINQEVGRSSLHKPLNVNEEFHPSSIEDQSPQNSSLNINKEFDPSSMENQSLKNPSCNINKEFDPSSMENQSLKNPPCNINKEFDPPSMETQSLKNPPCNINKEFDPPSMENRSLQNPSCNINKELDPSSMENHSLQNPPLNSKEFDLSSLENHSLQNPPFYIKKEFDPLSMKNQPTPNPPCSINKEFDPSSMENRSLQDPPCNINRAFDPSFIENQSLQNPPLNIKKEFDPFYMEDQSLRISSPMVNDKFGSSSMENKSSMDNPPLVDNDEFDPMDLNAENDQVSSDTSNTHSSPEHHVGQTSEISLGVSLSKTHGNEFVEMPRSSVNNMWTPIGLPESYSHTHQTVPLALSSEPTVRHPQLVPEQAPHLIVPEPDLPMDPTKDLLNSHTNHMPFINPLANRDTNDLQLQSLIQRDRFHQEQQKSRSVFHPVNALLEPNLFPGHIHDPSFVADHKPRTQSGLFTNPNIHDSIYSDINRYTIQGQEPFSALNMRDWANTRMSTPMQSQAQTQAQLNSGGQLNHSWFTNDTRAHSGWSAPEGTVFSTTGLGSGGGDQSLYSVLSQCNSLQPRPHYNLVGPSEQMMLPSTSSVQDVGLGMPMTSSPLPVTVSPFDYLSGGETSSTLKNPIMGWMGLGHQPSGLHDPSGKPFLKPWDQ